MKVKMTTIAKPVDDNKFPWLVMGVMVMVSGAPQRLPARVPVSYDPRAKAVSTPSVQGENANPPRVLKAKSNLPFPKHGGWPNQ